MALVSVPQLAQTLLIIPLAIPHLVPLLLSLLPFKHLEAKAGQVKVCRHFTAQIP